MFNIIGKICYNKAEGYSILLVLIIVGTISLTITTSVLLLGASFSRTSLTLWQSYQARHLATACAEEALQQIKGSMAFSGYGTLTLNTHICGYLVTNTGGTNRNIQASSTVGMAVRKVNINITKIKPQIVVSSWQEVANF